MGCGSSSAEVLEMGWSRHPVQYNAGQRLDFIHYASLLSEDKVTRIDLACFNARVAEARATQHASTALTDDEKRLNIGLLAKILPSAKSLEVLHLNQNKISAMTTEGRELLQALKQTGLKELYISKNPLGEAGVALMFTPGFAVDPNFFAQLRVLDLGNTGLTDQALEVLCQAATAASHASTPCELKRLSLAFNPDLSITGLFPRLAQLLSRCPKLEWISLASCSGLTAQVQDVPVSISDLPQGEMKIGFKLGSSPTTNLPLSREEESSLDAFEHAVAEHPALGCVVMFGTGLNRDTQSRIMRAMGERGQQQIEIASHM